MGPKKGPEFRELPTYQNQTPSTEPYGTCRVSGVRVLGVRVLGLADFRVLRG